MLARMGYGLYPPVTSTVSISRKIGCNVEESGGEHEYCSGSSGSARGCANPPRTRQMGPVRLMLASADGRKAGDPKIARGRMSLFSA